MRIVGPAIAAFLVGSIGPASCYVVDAVSFVGSALLIVSVPFVAPAVSVTILRNCQWVIFRSGPGAGRNATTLRRRRGLPSRAG